MQESYIFWNSLSTILTILFVCFILGIAFLYYYIKDSRQTKHTLRRNFPVLARGRWLLEHLGTFFRYYLVNNEREEEPFSRHSRSYVYKAGKNNKRNEAFGSTKSYNPRSFSFVHSMFPFIKEETQNSPIVFGEDTENPYTTTSLFNPSAMSFGALSKEAISAISQGICKSGGWMNTGEGGMSAYHTTSGVDIVFQIGTGKFNVGNEDNSLNIDKLHNVAGDPQVKMFEIKLSQGAKPGKGGILPAKKVNAEIASIRGIPEGKASISPNRHIEITDMESLLEFIYTIKSNTKKPTGIKLCANSPHELEELIKAIFEKSSNHLYRPDFITLDSSDGGTGAAPTAFLDSMGMNILESLPLLNDLLIKYNLKDKIKIISSGKLVTPVEVAWAFAHGADSVNTARGFLFALGCIQARQCNKNTCPTGITTNNSKLRKGLVPSDKAERVYYYHKNMNKDLMDIAHACGVESFELLTTEHIRYPEKISIKNL
jgi:glutamate synthase domain-containing protein 2